MLSNRKLKQKELFVFDLDGTIIETKSPMEPEMSKLITRLIKTKKVAIIGGGKYSVFQELFVCKLKCKQELFKNLFLFPATSTIFYKYHHGWKKIYALHLSSGEIKKIKQAFQDVFKEIGYKHPKKTYGKIIEDRGTQVSFSIYGQDLVKVLGRKGVRMKKEWLKKNLKLKMKIARLVGKKLPGLEVRAAGFTTIDVTRRGIDKAYGIHQIEKHLRIPIRKMFFIGDGIFPGGNDYAIVKTGIDYEYVKNPNETKEIINKVLSDENTKDD
ncbi:HAD-IIB family hydrolase [Candidatus Nomurabacteria bacterium]|nr:HAD-IIB family hydrolase [Candidatus Nomurabacteria bacterium]